ncbi:hypothetical protein [Shimia aestuarii]|uniref:Uncharacterized protein n=1 Tax=Shimia aestuarii TaxID=254406 RepID=A0A1I4IPP1_9RHOB|nr:hypothetical protein [Shimia aestuarii]SFL55973.1 hypothetical protein SAMN04488042_101681 [Shimia aestuarii]
MIKRVGTEVYKLTSLNRALPDDLQEQARAFAARCGADHAAAFAWDLFAVHGLLERGDADHARVHLDVVFARVRARQYEVGHGPEVIPQAQSMTLLSGRPFLPKKYVKTLDVYRAWVGQGTALCLLTELCVIADLLDRGQINLAHARATGEIQRLA